MGCGGSKQGVVAATGSCVSYRRLLRTRSGAANSHFKIPTAFADVAGKAPAAPATAKAAVAAALSDVVEEVTVEVDVVRMAAPSVGEEAERSRAAPPEEPPTSGYSTARSTDEEDGGGACAGDAYAGPREAKSNENGGGCAGERRGHHGWVHEAEEGEKMTCSLPPPNLCDAHDASKPGVHGEGPTDQGDQKTSPDQCNVQMEDLRMQLQQVAEQLADFQVWGREDDDNGDTEKAVTEEEKHQEEGLNTRLEEGPELFVKEPVFKEEEGEEEEDQFGDAAEVFKEDFSSKIPVYDEYPHDLPQVPSAGCDFSAEGNAITSYLSFGREGTDDDQIQQVLYQKFVKVRRSKAYGSGGKKRRTHYELHQTQIRKHRKRRTYEPVR